MDERCCNERTSAQRANGPAAAVPGLARPSAPGDTSGADCPLERTPAAPSVGSVPRGKNTRSPSRNAKLLCACALIADTRKQPVARMEKIRRMLVSLQDPENRSSRQGAVTFEGTSRNHRRNIHRITG